MGAAQTGTGQVAKSRKQVLCLLAAPSLPAPNNDAAVT